MVLFPFCESAHRPDLLSFPTRRSSDLLGRRLGRQPGLDAVRGRRIVALFDRSQRAPPRSEEHTSELQSHSDLVCRLLLEKKKPFDASSSRARSMACVPLSPRIYALTPL